MAVLVFKAIEVFFVLRSFARKETVRLGERGRKPPIPHVVCDRMRNQGLTPPLATT